MSAGTTTTSVRFGRLERRGVLLGLGGAQLGVAGLALVIATGAVYSAGMGGLLATLGLWGPMLVVATVSVAGRQLVDWIPLVGHWGARRALGQTTVLTSPHRVPPVGVLELPGIPGRLSVTPAPSTGAALVLDRRTGTVTAVLRVASAGFVLEDGATQDHKVAGWGRALASLCQQTAIVRVQVLTRTLPAGPMGAGSWRRQAAADGPWAACVLAELVAQAESTTDRRETLLALALRAPHGRRALRATVMGTLERSLSSFADALVAAELTPLGWLDPGGLGAVLHAAFDPEAAARACGELAAGRLLGPMGVAEHWDHLRTDGAVHAVYWVVEWPRSEVHPAFLQPLLLAPGARRTVTLLAEPLPPGKALREIRRAKAEHAADTAQRNRLGQIEDEAVRAEQRDLARREAELVAGHGDLRFTGLITVTAYTPEDLAAGCAATESAAAQAMCEVRRLVGQQGHAHAAGALPLARGLL